VPLLLELLFPESAESVLPVVSPRLLDWCSAFEAWREERRQSRPPSDRASVVRSWRKLLGECSKPPWEISQEDIQQHIAWLEASGYAPSTIKKCVSCIADFYRWRLEQQPDPDCPPGFNPTEGVQRPKASPNPQSPLFSKSELEALLNYMRRDVSALGRRDYAFVLARVHVGVSLQHLQRLRWEQIEVDGSGAWLRWRPGSARLPLPAEAWQAVRLWLEQSGRLPRMQPGDYIFTPLVDPLHEAAPDRPEAWDSGKFISYDRLSDNLRLYGRRLGLPEEKLNWNSLRLTAVRLRLDAGDSPEVLYNFLDRQRKRYSIQPYLKGLPELPPSADPTGPDNPARPERPRPAEQAADEPALPNRKPYVFQPWSNIKHGMSSFNLPPEQLSAVLAENIQGLEAEISGLRLLERALVALQITATNPREAGKLADACTLTGERLARLIEAEAQLGRPDEAAERMEGFFATMDEVHAEDEERPSGDEWRRFLEEDDDQPALAANSRSLEEETACARLVLRNIFALAESAAQSGQAAELAHLAEIYGSGCNRLVNLLRRNRSSSSRMEKKLEAMLNAALAEEQKSWTQY
jgi:hypothetical protein